MIKGILYTTAFCGLSAGGAFGLAFVHDIMDRTPASVVSVPMDVPTPAALNIDTVPETDAAPAVRIEQASLPAAPALEDIMEAPAPAPAIASRAEPEAPAAKPTPVRRTAKAEPKVKMESGNIVAAISTRAENDVRNPGFDVTIEDTFATPAPVSDLFPVTRSRGNSFEPRNRLSANWQTGVFR